MAWGGIEPPTQGFSVQDTPSASAKKRNGFLVVGVLLPNLLPNSFGPVGCIVIRFFYVNQRNGDADHQTPPTEPMAGNFSFAVGQNPDPPAQPYGAPMQLGPAVWVQSSTPGLPTAVALVWRRAGSAEHCIGPSASSIEGVANQRVRPDHVQIEGQSASGLSRSNAGLGVSSLRDRSCYGLNHRLDALDVRYPEETDICCGT